MPVKRIKRASEMAVVCICHPCVGFCEWDPRVGRSLIAQGAHCLARYGLSRWLEGWEGDKPKIFNQNDPLAFHKALLHHSDVGGPGDLWSWGALSYVPIVPWILYQFCTIIYTVRTSSVLIQSCVQTQFKTLGIQLNINYSLDSWDLCDFTTCTKINTVWSVIVLFLCVCVYLQLKNHLNLPSKESINNVLAPDIPKLALQLVFHTTGYWASKHGFVG